MGTHTLSVMGAALRDIEDTALLNNARQLINEGKADYVLTGHTHTPATKLRGKYLNGGCWIANQEVDSGSDASRIIFEHGHVAYKLTYLEIGPNGVPERKVFDSGYIEV